MTTKPKIPRVGGVLTALSSTSAFVLWMNSRDTILGRVPKVTDTPWVSLGTPQVCLLGPGGGGPGQRVALPAAPASIPPAPGGLSPVQTVPGPLREGHCINNKLYCIIYQASSAHRKKHSKPLTIKVTNSSICPGAS